MSQRSRQSATNFVEQDSFKLLNNANFVYNLDNCVFELICDETDKTSYIKP